MTPLRVLFTVHGQPPQANAGTELYVSSLARALVRQGVEVAVLTREFDAARPDFEVRRDVVDGVAVVRVNNGFRTVRSFEQTYRSAAIRAIGRELVASFRPDVAHVQHLTCLSTDLVFDFRAHGVPTVLTANDYWLFCQRGHFLDRELAPCPGPTPAACARCLWTDAAQSQARIAHADEVIAACDLVLCPSRSLRDRFVELGVPAAQLRVQVQGIDAAPFRGRAPREPGPLRVAFLGSLLAPKAPHLLLEAAAGLPSERVEVTLAGAYAPYHGDDGYRATLAQAQARTEARLCGDLDRAGVAALLGRTDVLVVTSIWSENAPFVIKEAFAAGVPVVAGDQGGMAELVQHERSGLLFTPGDAIALRRALQRLLDEPELLDRLRRGVPDVRSIEDDAAETAGVYRELLARPRR